MTDYQTTILNRLPEYASAERRSIGAGGLASRAKINTAEGVHAGLIEKAAALLESGKPVPENFGKPYVDALAADELANVRANILRVIEGRSANVVEGFKRNHADTILDELRKELAEVVDSVTDLATELTHVRSADEAISEGPAAVEAWAMLRTETARYRDIRRFQFELYDARDGNAYPGHPGMQVRESLDVDPYFVERRIRYAAQSASNSEANAAFKKWMQQAADGWSTVGGDDVFPTFGPEAHLLLLVRRYTLWLPAMAERAAFLSAAHAATARVLTNDAHQNINARYNAYVAAGVSNAYTAAGPQPVKQVRIQQGGAPSLPVAAA
jgi:hypothetical protein